MTRTSPQIATEDSIDLPQQIDQVLTSAIDQLASQQYDEGYWCAELEGDSILQSEYILLKWIVEQEKDPRLAKIANYLRSQQRLSDGAWVQYPGDKPDLSATVNLVSACIMVPASLWH